MAQLGSFLRSRRERLQPSDVGLPDAGGRRRARGLRREEVAQLAEMSVAWYTGLEQGRGVHPSRTTLDTLARVLRLEDAEREHLFRLAFPDTRRALTTEPLRDSLHGRAAVSVAASRLVPSPDHPDGTPPSVRRLLDALGLLPALVLDRYWDVVGYVLTNELWRRHVPEWPALARAAVGGLRASLAPVLAEAPNDARAAALLGQLERESAEFGPWWTEHALWGAERPLTHVQRHPTAGAMTFETQLLDLRSAPGLTLVVYTPCDAESTTKLRHLVAQRTGALPSASPP